MSSQNVPVPHWIDGGGATGDSAYSYVPEDHQGLCAVSYFSRGQQHWAIFPSRDIAITAAVGACRRDIGGYSNVAVYPVDAAALEGKRYGGVADWLLEGEDFGNENVGLTRAATILRRAMRELVRQIAACPHELAAVEWLDLERLLFEVFDALGFDTTLTRPSKDGGYDLRLEAEGAVYFVEVKHWSKQSKVGAGILDRFAEVVVANDGEGLLLSTSGFTDNVVKGRLKISDFPVVLGTDVKVISLCQYYVRSEGGLWVREGMLRDIFFQDAF